jgi:cob(I)alamin adenosyltransferase
MSDNQKGYIQVYTGDGKGKTTAAIGLAVRAAGRGQRTFIGQFMKGMFYGELEALKDNWLIEIKQFGWENCIRKDQVNDTHKEITRNGLEECRKKMLGGTYNLIILDEILVAQWFGLIIEKELLIFVDQKPAETELVLTGRNASEGVLEKADLITEMKNIRHYFDDGVQARKGIEY